MTDDEAAPARRLRRMQWLATGLLVLMAIVFVTTSLFAGRWPPLEYARAFAEAALIGGLADWFAVTALFRRPLGLPIPHTAIVPNRKDAIGRTLARFVGEHFLVRDALESELERLHPARALGRWLALGPNAASAARDVSKALVWALRDLESGPLRQAVVVSLGDLARAVPTRALLSALVDILATGPHAGHLVDNVIAFGREQLEKNRSLIRARIHERSPWWLPRFVDEEIFDQLVGELERILGEVGDDADHPARIAFRERLGRLSESIASDPGFLARSEALRDEFLSHPAVADFGRDVARRAHSSLVTALENPESALRAALERELGAVGRRLAEDDAIAAELDAWLSEVVIYLVETYREPMSSIISTTIARWDAAATSRRIELNIGRDLQFIRINGTLVGGLVGFLLYLSWTRTIA